MTRLSTFVASAAVLVLVAPVPGADARQERVQIPRLQTTVARAATQGMINGVVLDDAGRPLAGAMVSALGSTVAFALTDRQGRFSLESLPLGAYTVRVHLEGYAPSRRQVVEVRGTAAALVSVALQGVHARPAAAGPAVLVAGMSPFDAAPVSAAAGDPADADHDHSETAWRLRHLKRSVLKTVDAAAVLPDEPPSDGEAARFGQAFQSSMRASSSLFDAFPLSGQVNFVTTGAFGADSDFLSSSTFAAASVTYVALGAPVANWGAWSVRGAMRQGELGSWFLSGAFDGRVAGAHRYSGGLAYGTQQLQSANVLGLAAITNGTRSIGSVYGVDEWTVGRQLALSYGLAYAWQDYVSTEGLWSPRVAMTLMPGRSFRVRTIISRRATAPGADDLLPSAAVPGNSWLPAQHSFSPWSDRDGFRAQTTDHFEVAVERVSKQFVVGFRTFYQRVDDQMGAVFAAPSYTRPTASLGHYYVATVGDMSARGWTFSVSRPLIAGIRGSVDYSLTTTRWSSLPAGGAATPWFVGNPASLDRFHDLTTSVETDIPFTATRVFVLYKINTAFAREDDSLQNPGLDARFDVQVYQSLPFMDFTSTEWEVLVSVRNLFRDPMGERSVFDELMVVDPPKRVVGGVRVRF